MLSTAIGYAVAANRRALYLLFASQRHAEASAVLPHPFGAEAASGSLQPSKWPYAIQAGIAKSLLWFSCTLSGQSF